MTAAGFLFGDGPAADVVRELDTHPFEPVVEATAFRAPRATIDPDRSKGWIARAWPVLLAHKGIWALSLGASFVALVAQIQVPRLIGVAITDCLPSRGHLTGLRPLSGAVTWIVVAIGVREISNYLARRYILAAAYDLEYDLRHLIYERFMALSFPFYDRVSIGELISRANSDVRAVQQYLLMAPNVLIQCTVVLFAFIEMFSINVTLTLITAASLPITFLAGIAMRRQMYPISWLIQSRLADIAGLVQENVSGVLVVKSFAAEQDELTRLARSAHRLRWAYTENANIRGTWAPTLENLPRVGLAVILLYGGILVLHGQMGLGTLFTFQAYMLIFQPPFRQLGMVLMSAPRAGAAAERIYGVIDHEQEIANLEGATHIGHCRGKVVFEHVDFSYTDGTEVLHDFDLAVAPGETIALVGRTGSGKTTVGRLLNRSYDVTAGRVTVDGRDVRDYTLESIRANVGFVFDEPFLFSISIRDNIAYGRPNASLDEIVAAAKVADADEFISHLPDGYDTVIGERGYTLSGGQRQRLAIARAVLVNPPILVLDDATSAIDVQVERRIHSALSVFNESRTTIVVAHRLATIALADRVVFIEDGRVVATGTHEELLANHPRYAAVLARPHVGDDEDLTL